MTGKSLISVRNLSVHFPIGGAFFGQKLFVRAVNDVSMEIPAGMFFGLVGESGSGKTTFGRALLKAVPITEGHVEYNDEGVHYDLNNVSAGDLKDI